MLSDCLNCKEKAGSKNLRIVKTKNRIIMFLSKCVVCGNKISRFNKE